MFFINKLCLSNFKSYKDLRIFQFSNYTEIYGKNAQGKTSIAEGITWGLYGCDLYGDTKCDSKLMNNESRDMFVIIDYSLDGSINRIVRKKTESSITLKLNDKRISEKELSKQLPDKNLFLAIFNPVVFLSYTVSKQRELLFKILPPIKHNDIITKYNYSVNGIDALLTKYPKVNDGLKKIMSEIKNSKDLLTLKNNELDIFKKLIIENSNNTNAPESFTKSDEELLMELQGKLINNAQNTIPTDTLKSKIFELDSLIAIEKNKQYINSNDNNISELNISLAKLSGEFNLLSETYKKINNLSGVCSLCGQSITEEHKSLELCTLNNKLKSINSEISSYKESISLLKSLELSKYKTFQDNKLKSLNELEEKRKLIACKLDNIEESNKLLNDLPIKNDIEIKINQLKQKQYNYNNYKSEITVQNNTLNTYNNKCNKLQVEINNISKELADLDIKYHNLKGYSSLYIQYISEILSSWLNKVSINLFNTVESTGEIKDTFELKYENKPLRLVSKSEYVKVGLELSNMFNNALGINIPIFVDDGESILDIPILSTQMIVSKVKDCDLQIISSNIDSMPENNLELNSNIVCEQLAFN